jgi:diketogulonate reductase-like aldo/keto reductase
MMRTRAIPSTGELLPVIGLGTYRTFDAPPNGTLAAVVEALLATGGTVVDTSPMYGRAEQTVGDLLRSRSTTAGGRPFLATKVWTTGESAGIAQMERSRDLLGARCLDLIQIHNLVDWRTHARTLRRWKDDGRVRYIGITHYTSSAYDAVERVMRAEPFDFLQINYSVEEREAERRLLPLAAERGMAVLANRPLGQGTLLPRLARQPLPGWAAALGVRDWAVLALAFVVSHPAITCAIPATGNPEHMRVNALAGSIAALTDVQRASLSG